MKRAPFICGILLFLVGGTDGFARQLPDWPYERLMAEADLVLVARPVSNTATADRWKKEGDDYAGINTVLSPRLVLKGKTGGDVTLLHFRHLSGASLNGMEVIHFRLKSPRLTGEMTWPGSPRAPVKFQSQEGTPEYLLFLKRRGDGRYDPVSGPEDAALSVRKVADPDGYAEDGEK